MFGLIDIPQEQMEHYRAAAEQQRRQGVGFGFQLEPDCWLWMARRGWEEAWEDDVDNFAEEDG